MGWPAWTPYQEETVRIARLQVDGQPVSPGKIILSIGPHTIDVVKEGYGPEQLRIVVYPDVQPKVKANLKKVKR